METFNINSSVNIMAIDPGSNNLGVSIFEIELPTLKILSIDTFNINVSIYDNTDVLFSNLRFRLQRLEMFITEIVNKYNPRIVTIESGFINKLRPAAYGPLSQTLAVLEHTILSINPFIRIFTVSPSVIKINVNASFKADKNEVLDSINKITEISNCINPYLLTEHEVDSIAINYTMLNTLRTDGGFLLCLV